MKYSHTISDKAYIAYINDFNYPAWYSNSTISSVNNLNYIIK